MFRAFGVRALRRSCKQEPRSYIVSETHLLGDLGGYPDRANEDDSTESETDAEGQRLAENEQEQPRSIIQKIGNAIEDAIPGDSDNDGH
jgi:hypothetical protein